ncbi:transposase [Pontibacter ramchanderi]|nr:transposase [Pontibacter ramchanderi]
MRRSDRKQNRLNGYDYSRDALYFVTSCVKDKSCVFGKVVDSEMHLNSYGFIAEQQWYWLQEQYPYVISHAFVVMPNHVHGILEIDNSLVGTGRDLSTLELSNETDVFPISAQKIKSLSEIIGAYKTTSSKLIRTTGLTGFEWQRSFHDHIIRSDKSYGKIKDYILSNPERWADDVFFER